MADETRTHDVVFAAEDMVQEADQLRARRLRKTGWTYTSSTPGCVWMWCKVWQGKQWTYGGSERALAAQLWMEDHPDTSGVAPCAHRIADARNEVVQSGYVCVDCGAVFAAAGVKEDGNV